MLKTFDEIFSELKSRGTRKRMVAAWGVDNHTIAAAGQAVALGLVDVTLVGDAELIAQGAHYINLVKLGRIQQSLK